MDSLECWEANMCFKVYGVFVLMTAPFHRMSIFSFFQWSWIPTNIHCTGRSMVPSKVAFQIAHERFTTEMDRGYVGHPSWQAVCCWCFWNAISVVWNFKSLSSLKFEGEKRRRKSANGLGMYGWFGTTQKRIHLTWLSAKMGCKL